MEFFLTAPLEPVTLRRGDPLGFRPAADVYADLFAPGLTNRTWDARWMTILSWCLVEVDAARRTYGIGDGLDGMALRRDIYAWLRPLELAWVAQAVRAAKSPGSLNGRQLPGRRAIQIAKDAWARERFGLSADQYRRYRFTGPHGAYRGLLGSLEDMTLDADGHRPGAGVQRLADVLRTAIPVPKNGQRLRGRKPSPESHWAWAWSAARGTKGDRFERWLPRSPEHPPRIVAGERAVLAPRLFERGPAAERRRTVARLAARSTAKDHAALCRDIAAGLRGVGPEERELLRRVERFARLADAGVDAMETVWEALTARDARAPALRVEDVTRLPRCRDALDTLVLLATRWKERGGGGGRGVLGGVDALAASLSMTRVRRANRADSLRALAEHHVERGTGRRWFRLLDGKISLESRHAGGMAARYRFRLWSLGRLSWQMGITHDMPRALGGEDERGAEAEVDA